jgi:ADP-ribosylation factor-like protein 2
MQALQLDDIKTHRWNVVECSAMTGLNLHEGLQWVIQDAKDRLFLF